MEIIHPEYVKYVYEVNRLRIKLAELITYRDSLKYHITKSLNIDYMLKLGALECKLLKTKGNIEKDQRLIDLIKAENLSFEEANEVVKKEYLEQDYKIALMDETVEKAIKDSRTTVLSEKEIIEINSYYMPLVKDLSPEINPNNTIDEKDLFAAIRSKYINGNISEIKKFKRFEKSDLYFDELEVYKSEKPRLTELVEKVNSEINKIKSVYPYTKKVLVYDEILCRRRKDSLNKEIDENQAILDDLEKQIKKFKK